MTANISQQVVARRTSSFKKSRLSSKNFYLQRGALSAPIATTSLVLIIVVSLTLLSFLYLQQVVHTASHGSNIQELEGKVLELKEAQRDLELEGAQLRSIQNVEDRVKELNLERAESVAYLAPTTGRVARFGE